MHDTSFPESNEPVDQRTDRAIEALKIEESAGLGFRRRRSGTTSGNPYAKPEQYQVGGEASNGELLAGFLVGIAWVLGAGALIYHPLALGTIALIAGVTGAIAGGKTAQLAKGGLMMASFGFFFGMIIAIGLGRPIA